MDQGIKMHTKGRHMCGRNAGVEGDIFLYKADRGNVGVVKILEPVSPMYNYFEMEIISRGQKCALGLGVGEHGYPLERMPGWNRNSMGYHADDGRLFHQDGYGKAFGPTCTEGDRMGCGVDFDTGDNGYVNVFFTKNGKQIGDVVRMKRPIYGLYPLIGMHSRGEKVRYLGHWNRVFNIIQEPMVQESSPSNHWLRSNGIRFMDNSLTLEYSGDGLNRQDVGIAQARFCLSRQQHYFEMDILNSGKEGWLAIGLAKTTYPLHRHPGWNKGSVGYHADNGHLYKEKGHGEPFGPTCTEGDTMGCGIRFKVDSELELNSNAVAATSAADYISDSEQSDDFEEDYEDELNMPLEYISDDDYYYDSPSDDELGFGAFGRGRLGFRRQPFKLAAKPKKAFDSDEEDEEVTCEVYFTKNGEEVGRTECVCPKGGFYPVVAMLSQGEKVRVNFNPLSG